MRGLFRIPCTTARQNHPSTLRFCAAVRGMCAIRNARRERNAPIEAQRFVFLIAWRRNGRSAKYAASAHLTLPHRQVEPHYQPFAAANLPRHQLRFAPATSNERGESNEPPVRKEAPPSTVRMLERAVPRNIASLTSTTQQGRAERFPPGRLTVASVTPRRNQRKQVEEESDARDLWVFPLAQTAQELLPAHTEDALL